MDSRLEKRRIITPKHLHPFQSGQELVEYLFFGIIVVVIILVAISYLSQRFSNFFSEESQSVPVTEESNEIVIGEIQVEDEQVETVIDIEQIMLPNCNGSSDLTISRELSKTTSRSVQFTNSIDSGLDINSILTDISLSIYSALEIENTNEISQTTTIEVTAAPGSSMTYPVEWLEVKVIGTVELITSSGEVSLVNFAIPDALRINVREPIRTACD